MPKPKNAPAEVQEPVVAPASEPVIVASEAAPAEPAQEPVVDAAPQSDPAPASSAQIVKARVLVGCVYGHCDDVVEIEAKLIEQLAGVVDTDPAAVAYAESLAAG
jgi:hypothetical protein